MGVYIVNHGQRWDVQVPYVIGQEIPEGDPFRAFIHQAVAEFNQLFDQPVLIERNGEDDFISFSNQPGHSPVGRQGGEQHVLVGNEQNMRVFRHEVCHAIGMRHEQYHIGYPWQNIPETEFDNFHIPIHLQGENVNTFNVLCDQNHYHADLAAGIQIHSLVETFNNQDQYIFTEHIDWDSVMMYSQSKLQNPVPNQNLSQIDIQCVLQLLGRVPIPI